VIEQHGPDGRIPPQIVLVWRVIAVPRDDVERRVIEHRRPHHAAPLHEQPRLVVGVFERRDWREEVARVRQAVGADRAAIGQRERAAVVLAEIPAGGTVAELDADLDAARNHRDLAGLDLDQAELRADPQAAALRHEQQFAVRVVEVLVLHRARDEIHVCAHAGLRARVAAVVIVRRPSTNDVGAVGIARGLHRIGAIGTSTSWHGAVRHKPMSTCSNGPMCATVGRMR
jgi:hypothetical protein